jgi:hypothetical protein
MSFPHIENPKTLIRLGFVFVILSGLSRWFLPPMPGFSENLVDGTRGLLLGLAIGFLLFGTWRNGRGRSDQNPSGRIPA